MRRNRVLPLLALALVVPGCDGAKQAPRAEPPGQPGVQSAPVPPPTDDAAGAHSASDALQLRPTLFGLTLARPLDTTISQCPKRYKANGPAVCMARPDEAVRLYTDRPHFGGAWLVYRWDQLPDWVLDATLEVELVDGRVERIAALTNATTAVSAIEHELRAKFGPPTSETRGTLQNGFGATFETVEQEWVSKDFRITYHSMLPGSSHSGALIAATLDSDRRARERAQDLAPKRPL